MTNNERFTIIYRHILQLIPYIFCLFKNTCIGTLRMFDQDDHDLSNNCYLCRIIIIKDALIA